MRKMLCLLLLLCSSVFALSQETILFISADQQESTSGWQLHIILDMVEMPWPPHFYQSTDVLLSDAPMGPYEPYGFTTTLRCHSYERDPVFSLTGKMETNKTWYGRVQVWADGAVVAKTEEFTFILPEGEPQKFYHGDIPWAAVDDAWQTSIAVHNSQEENVSLTYATWTGPEQNPIRLEGTVVIWPHTTFSAYIFPESTIHAAIELTSTLPVSWMSLLNLRDTSVWIGFNGNTE